MQIQICYNAIFSIESFYENVAIKYKHTYDYSLMRKNIDEIIECMYKIENGLPRLTPTIRRWRGRGFMARSKGSKQWFFLYTIEGDTIYVIDACHAQNMHESVDFKLSKYIREYLKYSRVILSESKTGTKQIRLNEGQLRDMLNYVVHCVLNEEYKVVDSPDHFFGDTGIRINNPVLSLENEYGGKTHVVEDDGCYVAYNNIGDTDRFVSITHLYPELFNAMKKLPNLPQQ